MGSSQAGEALSASPLHKTINCGALRRLTRPLDWLKLLLAEDIPAETLREKNQRKAIPPLYGALLKNEQDVSLFEKIAFMARRGS